MNTKNDRFKISPEQKKAEADKGLADYRAREAAVNKNTERLRALRLAHEAENPPVPKAPKAKAKAKVAAKPPAKKKTAKLSQYLKQESESGRGT